MRNFLSAIAASTILVADLALGQNVAGNQDTRLFSNEHKKEQLSGPAPAPDRKLETSAFPPGPLALIVNAFPPGHPPRSIKRGGPFLVFPDPRLCGVNGPDSDPLSYSCISDALNKECNYKVIAAATVAVRVEDTTTPGKHVALKVRGKGGNDTLCGGSGKDRQLPRVVTYKDDARGSLGAGCDDDILVGICSVCHTGRDEDLLSFEPSNVCSVSSGTPQIDGTITDSPTLESVFKKGQPIKFGIHTSCSNSKVICEYSVEALILDVN